MSLTIHRMIARSHCRKWHGVLVIGVALSGGMGKPIERNGFRDVDKLVIINVNGEQGPKTSLDRSDSRLPAPKD